jgi:hypothetical protein
MGWDEQNSLFFDRKMIDFDAKEGDENTVGVAVAVFVGVADLAVCYKVRFPGPTGGLRGFKKLFPLLGIRLR